jgi:ubiquinone/menaquinone biosynthesis C-methylase UbiE
MRVATRRAAGLEPGGWTPQLRKEVAEFFDALSGEWHTRTSAQRTAIVADALERGLGLRSFPSGVAVEVGSGIGTYSSLLAQRFAMVIAIDLSLPMLKQAPPTVAHRIQGDGALLPLRDKCASAIVLINAFLFPAEVHRVLSSEGALVWVNSSGPQTPIFLNPDDLLSALPGKWGAVTSQAGEGTWSVLRRT